MSVEGWLGSAGVYAGGGYGNYNNLDIGGTPDAPPGGTPGYATIHFRYGRMITERQRLSLNVENLFDEQYRVHGSGSDGPGINALVTYELVH